MNKKRKPYPRDVIRLFFANTCLIQGGGGEVLYLIQAEYLGSFTGKGVFNNNGGINPVFT